MTSEIQTPLTLEKVASEAIALLDFNHRVYTQVDEILGKDYRISDLVKRVKQVLRRPTWDVNSTQERDWYRETLSADEQFLHSVWQTQVDRDSGVMLHALLVNIIDAAGKDYIALLPDVKAGKIPLEKAYQDAQAPIAQAFNLTGTYGLPRVITAQLPYHAAAYKSFQKAVADEKTHLQTLKSATPQVNVDSKS